MNMMHSYFLALEFFILTTFAFNVQEQNEAQCLQSNASYSVVRGIEGKLMNPKSIQDSYHKINFALRGPIYLRTTEIQQGINMGIKKPFTDLLYANIVDSQGMGQKPNTFMRQLLSLVSYPALINSSLIFPSDAIQRAKELFSEMKGATIGSLTGARGLEIVRKKIVEFISKRDNISANVEDIYLTNGVSGGLEIAFKLAQLECKDVDVGIMTPIPLYPLYSALITQHHLTQINYNLNPDNDWALEIAELERAYKNATCLCNCKPRAIVIINPGNPSGRILRRNSMDEIIKFAYSHNLIVFSDEIYQHSLLGDAVPFISMHKVVKEMKAPYDQVELISFYSISKGYASEGGLRGGYMHLVNIDKGVHDVVFKLLSVKQCPSVMGQVGLYGLVNQPKAGEESYDLFMQEVSSIVQSHEEIAKTLALELNKIKGFNCSQPEGGSVVFVEFKIPKKAMQEAELNGQSPDILYGLELLEAVGVSTAVGSAFGLSPTRHYMRISLPSSIDVVEKLVVRLKTFNELFMSKYS